MRKVITQDDSLHEVVKVHIRAFNRSRIAQETGRGFNRT